MRGQQKCLKGTWGFASPQSVDLKLSKICHYEYS